MRRSRVPPGVPRLSFTIQAEIRGGRLVLPDGSVPAGLPDGPVRVAVEVDRNCSPPAPDAGPRLRGFRHVDPEAAAALDRKYGLPRVVRRDEVGPAAEVQSP